MANNKVLAADPIWKKMQVEHVAGLLGMRT